MFSRFRMEIDTGLPAPEVDDTMVGRITKESFITINIPEIVSGTAARIVESNTVISSPDMIAVTDFSVSAAANTESVTTVYTQGTGNIFSEANNQLAKIGSSTLTSLATRELQSFAPEFISGNNTMFLTTSGGAKEVANGDIIMIVDQVGSTANGEYTVNKVFSNTTLSLTTAYGNLSNGEFYLSANTTTITT